LGARLIDGHGELLSFGGTVMKNVAGYDVSRLLAGSMGILGVIVDVSLKVLPRPITHHTLRFEMSAQAAVDKLNEWAGQPLPLSASAWHQGVLYLRVAGAVAAVNAAKRLLGGDDFENSRADEFWHSIREQTHPFFSGDTPLWRVAVPSTAAALPIECPQLIEWGGALRWLRANERVEHVRAIATQAGGHATLFRGGDRSAGVFTPLAPTLATIHRRLKAQFDPAGIFNPGRMYLDL
jgi:glycolate oxidase FAD binding subunit